MLIKGIWTGTTVIENSLSLPYIVKHRFSIWLRNSTASYIPRINRIMSDHVKTCTWMFIAGFLIIASMCKQSNYSSADAWINKIWYIYIVEYYLAIKEWSIDTFYYVIELCKHGKSKKPVTKTTYCVIPFIWKAQNW